jgi:hypothetical protein
MFNYSRFQVVFNYRTFHPMPRKSDYGYYFRDGSNRARRFTRPPDTEDYDLLHDWADDARRESAERIFSCTQTDRQALELSAARIPLPEITTWIRATEKDFDLVKEIGVSEKRILVSSRNYHIFKK